MRFAASQDYTNNATATWFDLSGTGFYHSSLVVFSLQGQEPQNSGSWYYITACVIDAVWYRTSVKYTNGLTSTDSAAVKVEALPKTIARIVIDPEWARALTELYLSAAPLYDTAEKLDDLAYYPEQVLALGLADANNLSVYRDIDLDIFAISAFNSLLSSTQYDSMIRFLNDEKVFDHYDDVVVFGLGDWTDPASLTQYAIRSYEAGYGYDVSTIPVQLSLAVLFIYVLVVASYKIYTLASGRTVTSWDSIDDLVVLALKSRPPEHMQASSVGVGTMSTYRKRMNIRIHSKNNEAEMVFDDDPGFRKDEYKSIQPNEKY